jgi:methionyl-tRNA formyltransferase
VFLGSGEFAIPILDTLAAHPAVLVTSVLTTPPRAAGRTAELRSTPVAAHAEGLGLPVVAPERLRDPAAVASLGDPPPGLLVLADYGRIVPRALLELPVYGALNLHPSLLPRHRGATPVAAAILAGDRETGASLIQMDEGIDTGPIIAQAGSALEGDETAPELEARLAGVAARLLEGNLSGWLDGTLRARPQPTEGATLTRSLRRIDGLLDPRQPAAYLERQVRAYQPWPASFLDTSRGRLIVWKARVAPSGPGPEPPGLLVAAGTGVALTTTDGRLELLEVQSAGGRRMPVDAWARGARPLPRLLTGPGDTPEAGRR